MQHETKMENQSWLKKLARRLGPGHVVNLCFIVVLLFSTLLTWREVVVLEDAYISSQRNHLENVANALDKHLQYNVDKLICWNERQRGDEHQRLHRERPALSTAR